VLSFYADIKIRQFIQYIFSSCKRTDICICKCYCKLLNVVHAFNRLV